MEIFWAERGRKSSAGFADVRRKDLMRPNWEWLVRREMDWASESERTEWMVSTMYMIEIQSWKFHDWMGAGEKKPHWKHTKMLNAYSPYHKAIR